MFSCYIFENSKFVIMLGAAVHMHFLTILACIILMLTNQSCNCKENQVFSNSVLNEVTIEDYIEDDIFFEILYPKDLQYTYRLRKARNFGSLFPYSYKGVRLVVADPMDCCSYPYNADNLKGSVALVQRGHCSFVSKALKAEKAGAIAVIIMDDNIENDELYIVMIDDSTNREPNIPASFLLGKSGYIIQKTLKELHLDTAIINIPVNMSSVALHKFNQPPWILW